MLFTALINLAVHAPPTLTAVLSNGTVIDASDVLRTFGNLEVAPRRGRAVVFFPGRLDGTLDPQLYHEARPAVDTKWVSQIWVRQLADPCRNVPQAWIDALPLDEVRGEPG